MAKIVGFYQGFKNVKTVVDVGGGVGMALAEIIGVMGLILIFLVSLQMLQIYQVSNMWEGTCLRVYLPSVLHDWDDERCLKILENCRKALPENGKIMLAESVLPEHLNPNQGREILSDLVMIAHTNGGRERSEGQWRGLLEKAGFSGIKIVGRAEHSFRRQRKGRLLWNQNRRKSRGFSQNCGSFEVTYYDAKE
eukprot:Gb_23397 [translate_table: standard]